MPLAQKLTRGRENPPWPQSLAALLAQPDRNSPQPRHNPNILPSGLTLELAASLANAIAQAFDLIFDKGNAFPLSLKPDQIFLRPASFPSSSNSKARPSFLAELVLTQAQAPTSNKTELLADAAKTTGNLTQAQAHFYLVLTGLFYQLVTGQPLPELEDQSLNQNSEHKALQTLALTYPEVAKVLRLGWQHYHSARELAGAFGWALYQHQHSSLASDLKTNQFNFLPGAFLNSLTRSLLILKLGFSRLKTGRILLPLVAGLSLVSLLLLWSAGPFSNSPSSSSQTRATNSPLTPALTPSSSDTATSAVAPWQVTRQSDGSWLTSYNPAVENGSNFSLPYLAPSQLQPGQVSPLSQARPLQIKAVNWLEPEQKLGLALEDGGWESWDIAAHQRLTRKQLPGSSHYLKVSWSPDGQSFAALTLDGLLHLGTNQQVLRVAPYAKADSPDYSWQITYGYASFRWSPDSHFLVVRYNNDNPQLWHFDGQSKVEPVQPPAQTPSQLAALSSGPLGRTGPLESWVWSADGRYLMVPYSPPTRVAVYDLTTSLQSYLIDLELPSPVINGESATRYLDNQGGPFGLSWSPDGKHLALLRWAFSPTNPASGLLETTAILFTWDLPSLPTPQATTPSKTGFENTTPAAESFSFNLKLSKPEVTLLDQFSHISYSYNFFLSWSEDNRLLIAARQKPSQAQTQAGGSVSQYPSDNLAAIYQREATDKPWQLIQQIALPKQTALTLVSWSPQGRQILVNTELGFVGVYQLAQAQSQNTTPATNANPASLQVLAAGSERQYYRFSPSPDGRYLAFLDSSGVLNLRELNTSQTLARLSAPPSNNRFIYWGALEWSPDSQYLAAFYMSQQTGNGNLSLKTEPLVLIWQLKDSQSPQLYGELLLPQLAGYSNILAWTRPPDKPGLYLRLSDKLIGRWNLQQRPPSLDQQRQLLEDNPNLSPAVSPFGGLYQIAGQVPGYVSAEQNWLWYPDRQRVIVGSNFENYSIYPILAPPTSPDATATKANQGIVDFDPAPFSRSTSQGVVLAGGGNVAIGPDGKLIGMGLPNGTIRIYDGRSGKLVQQFQGHQGYLTNLVFSPDGSLLASVGSDGIVKIWQVKQGWQKLASLEGYLGELNSLGFLSDSQTLLVTGNGNSSTTSLLWRIK